MDSVKGRVHRETEKVMMEIHSFYGREYYQICISVENFIEHLLCRGAKIQHVKSFP